MNKNNTVLWAVTAGIVVEVCPDFRDSKRKAKKQLQNVSKLLLD